jgi:transcriptional regulator with XRE-family HTH domain
MPTQTQRFAENLRRARLARGMSQQALATACRLHLTEVSLLERAGREPRLSTITRLAHGLKMHPGELLDGINPKAPRR